MIAAWEGAVGWPRVFSCSYFAGGVSGRIDFAGVSGGFVHRVERSRQSMIGICLSGV